MKNSTRPLKIALLGNPNIGKTTIFNKLCGLNQRTGNYPGVTVDKKVGRVKNSTTEISLVDLPGINSLFPNSKDEELVVDYLLDIDSEDYPDKLIVVVSALNLKRNLYLFDQIRDLNVPIVLVVNMIDLAKKRGVFIDLEKLKSKFNVPVVFVSAKYTDGIDRLIEVMSGKVVLEERPIHYLQEENKQWLEKYAKLRSKDEAITNLYPYFLELTGKIGIDKSEVEIKDEFIAEHNIDVRNWKTNSSILRYKYINEILADAVKVDKSMAVDLTSKLDKMFLHPIWGYLIFALIMFGIFQAIFWLASYPMDLIDAGFSQLGTIVNELLPAGYFTRLITEGLIPGLGGVVIFIPQIAILFLLFSILEESGYMSRIVYLTDRLMQRFGMSGKSIVPMISGLACAIPAIMAARTIENSRERLITILVTPLLTCSARIPVYVVIIALIVPDTARVWIFNAQGVALMGMYLLGVLMTFLVAFVLKSIMKPTYKSYLLMEMPEYLRPDSKNVLIRVWTNVKAFVWNAGKIIVATAVILFVLATNGGDKFARAKEITQQAHASLSEAELAPLINSYRIENSYLGIMGRAIEPAIKPLGYDWKIGIAIISSLAAREVFVGTISIIYAIDSDEEMTIRDRLKKETNTTTGLPVFGIATSVSLLLFYAFSLQCMSTVAVTYKETKSFKWTSIQFIYMTILAYFAALIAYQILK
jgi:ferrous iron transport protein B